jgi:hypothetical protein
MFPNSLFYTITHSGESPPLSGNSTLTFSIGLQMGIFPLQTPPCQAFVFTAGSGTNQCLMSFVTFASIYNTAKISIGGSGAAEWFDRIDDTSYPYVLV